MSRRHAPPSTLYYLVDQEIGRTQLTASSRETVLGFEMNVLAKNSVFDGLHTPRQHSRCFWQLGKFTPLSRRLVSPQPRLILIRAFIAISRSSPRPGLAFKVSVTSKLVAQAFAVLRLKRGRLDANIAIELGN